MIIIVRNTGAQLCLNVLNSECVNKIAQRYLYDAIHFFDSLMWLHTPLVEVETERL